MNIKLGKIKSSSGPEIDLTPMIDAIFNLIIFFMVGLTMKPPIDSEIILPGVIHYDEQKNTEIILYLKNAEIDTQGEIITPGEMFINHEKVTVDTLKEKIRQQMKVHDKKKLVIKADKNVFYRTITEVMQLAKKVGIEEFAIATTSELTGVGQSRAFKYRGEK